MARWEGHVAPGVVLYTAYPDVIVDPEALLQRLRQVAFDPFFSVVELGSLPDPAVRRAVRQVAAESGLRLVVSGGPRFLEEGIDLGAADAALRARSLSTAYALVEEALAVDAEVCMLISGPHVSDPAHYRASFTRLEEALNQVCDYAHSRAGDRLLITLETFDQTGHRRRLVGPTIEAAAMAGRIMASHPQFGLTLDMSHVPQLGEELEAAVTAAGPALRQAHVANCLLRDRSHPLWGDCHPRFGYPGSEHRVTDIIRYIRALAASGYHRRRWPNGSPGISVEVRPAAGEDPEMIFAGAARVLRGALSEVEFT